MRVRRSAIGSCMLIVSSSPARLRQAGDVAAHRGLAQLHARQPELAVHAARAARDRAAVALADRIRIPRQRLQLRLRGSPLLRARLGLADRFLQCGAPGRVLLHDLGATLLAFDHVGLGHGRAYLVTLSRNGKLKASRSARPCLSSRAVVVIVMSMPRTASMASYWISGKMIC